MSKKNHTLATIIIILCLVIGGTLLFYHFAPSSPTRIPPKNLPPSQTPIEETEHSTAHIEESKDSVYRIVVVVGLVATTLFFAYYYYRLKQRNHTFNLKRFFNSLIATLTWFFGNVNPEFMNVIKQFLVNALSAQQSHPVIPIK